MFTLSRSCSHYHHQQQQHHQFSAFHPRVNCRLHLPSSITIIMVIIIIIIITNIKHI